MLLRACFAEDGRLTSGDCMRSVRGETFESVDCGDSQATHRILGRVDGQSKGASLKKACDKYPETTDATWQFADADDPEGDGSVFCLEPLPKNSARRAHA